MVDKKSSLAEFSDFIYCLGSLERKNSQLFEELANKSAVSEVKENLRKISVGNECQAKVIIEMSEKLGKFHIKSHGYNQRLKPVCKITESYIDKVRKKKSLSAKELSDILLALENSGGAMQYLQVQAETFLCMSKEISKLYGMDFKDFEDHVMEIAHQIEEHIELLEDIKTKLTKTDNKKKDNVHHPVVRYQRPDAWIFSSN